MASESENKSGSWTALILVLGLMTAAFGWVTERERNRGVKESNQKQAEIEAVKLRTARVEADAAEKRRQAQQAEDAARAAELAKRHTVQKPVVAPLVVPDIVIRNTEYLCRGCLDHVTVKFVVANQTSKPRTISRGELNLSTIGLMRTELAIEKIGCDGGNIIGQAVHIDVIEAKPGRPIPIGVGLVLPPNGERAFRESFWFDRLPEKDQRRFVARGHIVLFDDHGECASVEVNLGCDFPVAAKK